MQEQLVHLVPGGKQVVTKNTGHFVQLTDPEVVINAIRRMVMDIRRRG